MDKIPQINPIKSKVSKWVSFIYNTCTITSGLIALISNFLDDDWIKSHNLDNATKTITGIGAGMFAIWLIIYLVIPKIKNAMKNALIGKLNPEQKKAVKDLIKQITNKSQKLDKIIEKNK